MTRRLRRTICNAVWGGLFLAHAGLSPLHAQTFTAYEGPDFTRAVFDPNRLGLDPAARNRLSTVLAAGVTYYKANLDAKILGTALRLDPANRAALDAAERRRKGELPDPKAGNQTIPPATVVVYLVGQSSGLRARGGADNLALAGCLSDIAVGIDPDNPAAQYEKTAVAKVSPPPAPTTLPGAPPAASEALPPLKRQSKIRGLSISDLPNAQRTGAVMEIIATAEEARSRQDLGVATSRPVGRSMQIALEEAWRAVKVRHPGTGAGQRLVISFDNNYSSKDGPSAGAAFALVLYSLYDPVRFAEDCAMTGDMTVDGRVRAVGGVPWKIHAAQVDGCRVVAIPRQNANAVADVPLIFPANTLWKLQIITVDTLDEALAVMREDRPADLQRAMDLFAAVQRKLGPGTLGLTSANADLIPTLREILRLAPGHASADAMLKTLEGRGARTLSLYTSLDELGQITEAALNVDARVHEQERINAQSIALGVANLETMRPRLDFRTADLCAAELTALRTLQGLILTRPTSEQVAEYRRCVQTIDEVQRRMSSDPSLIEALRH